MSLPLQRCSARGCSNTFRPKTRRARYCSNRCYRTYWERLKKGSRSLASMRFDSCPRGHDRSLENYAKDKNGKPYCRACHRENARARRSDPVTRERELERRRETARDRYQNDPEWRERVKATNRLFYFRHGRTKRAA